MKQFAIIILLTLFGTLFTKGQRNLNLGLGYAGEAVTSPGIVLEFEREKLHSADFSLPARADITFLSTPDYYGFYFDVHKGFRKYFRSGLYLEQSVGIGYAAKRYKSDDFWYIDNYGSAVAHGGKVVWGLMPSVTAGAGYSFDSKAGGSNLLWIRPKVFWDLGTRALTAPYFSLQIGYTHSLKTY